MTETLEQFLYKNHTKKTAESYLKEINNFKARNPKARFYKYNDIVTCLEKLREIYPNDSTLTRVLASIKRYYDYLVESGKRNDHPCRKLFIGRKKKYIQTQDLFSREELLFLFDRENRYKVLEIRNKLIISLLIYQALTSDDIIRLTVGNIDFEKGTIYIKSSATLRRRKLELHPTQHNLLNKYLNEIRPKLLKTKTDKLILGKLGTEITVDGINSIFDQFKELYPDRKLNPQTIRQSTISYWLNEKKYLLEDVQDLAGHKHPSSTRSYRKIDVEGARKWINKFHPLG